ncbi:hypothetical protein I312_105140 [Cryptococcus bacillisporus CA1280]|uniref:uncharacterized protein n=1 Tax=Cryptococcus bacillisporus CA1280 TaxID=1296109 RepID=UPI0033669749
MVTGYPTSALSASPSTCRSLSSTKIYSPITHALWATMYLTLAHVVPVRSAHEPPLEALRCLKHLSVSSKIRYDRLSVAAE